MNNKPEPRIITPIKLSSLLSVVIYFEVAMMHTPPKLRTMAIASNREMVSLKKHHPSKVAQKVAVLKMMIWVTRGIIETPNV